MQSWRQSAYAWFSAAVPLPWAQDATHSVVAFAAAASGDGTAMHFAWQSTSPDSQASRQAAAEAWAALVVVTEATEETVEAALGDVWALASTAKAPATMKLVKRILDVCK